MKYCSIWTSVRISNRIGSMWIRCYIHVVLSYDNIYRGYAYYTPSEWIVFPVRIEGWCSSAFLLKVLRRDWWDADFRVTLAWKFDMLLYECHGGREKVSSYVCFFLVLWTTIVAYLPEVTFSKEEVTAIFCFDSIESNWGRRFYCNWCLYECFLWRCFTVFS